MNNDRLKEYLNHQELLYPKKTIAAKLYNL